MKNLKEVLTGTGLQAVDNINMNFTIRIKHKRNPSCNLGGTKQLGPIIDLDGEIWRKHPDFDNYEFSNKGRIKNILLNTLMSESCDSDGYVTIGLRTKGKRVTRRIHKIIAQLFVSNPNPNYYNIVNHINGIRNDNRAENLEWTNIKSNVRNQNRGLSSLSKSLEYKDKNGNIKIFESIEEAAQYFNITRCTLRYRLKNPEVCRNRIDWLNGGSIKIIN